MSSGDVKNGVPFITTEQMREVDRIMIEEYGILLLQMMENAGRNLAHLARTRFLAGNPRNKRVLVLAGRGGNGGGGLVCARRLHNWGVEVRVWTTSPASELSSATRHQLAILERMGLSVEVAGAEVALPETHLVIDALLGYGLHGEPRGATATLISAANARGASILALDVPSGVDTTTGAVRPPAIKAAATLTLAMPKQGLRSQAAREHVGELYLGDIGVPPELYSRPCLGFEVRSLFAIDDIVRLW